MTVLRSLPADPTDLVIQGGQMRLTDYFSAVDWEAARFGALRAAGVPAVLPWREMVSVQDDEIIPGLMELNSVPHVPIRCYTGANAVVATQSGSLVPIRGAPLLPGAGLANQGTQMYSITGITRDDLGAVLPSCEVWLFDPSGNHIDTVTSDGVTGAYNFGYPSIGQNGYYLVAAWKAGDTQRGVTARSLTPAAS